MAAEKPCFTAAVRTFNETHKRTTHAHPSHMLTAGRPVRPGRPAPLALPGEGTAAGASASAAAAGGSASLVDGTPPVTPTDGGSLQRLVDALTPHTRKVSRLPLGEVNARR